MLYLIIRRKFKKCNFLSSLNTKQTNTYRVTGNILALDRDKNVLGVQLLIGFIVDKFIDADKKAL